MSIKYKEYQSARNEGIQFALKIVKEHGMEALEEEAKFRQYVDLPLKVDKEQYKEALTEMYNNIVDTIMTITVASLNRQFSFGPKRIERFRDRFEFICECVSDGDNVTLKEIAEDLYEEEKIKTVMEIRRVAKKEEFNEKPIR